MNVDQFYFIAFLTLGLPDVRPHIVLSTLQMSSPGHGERGSVRVSHHCGIGLFAFLYGLRQSSPHELAFKIELDPRPFLNNNNIKKEYKEEPS